MGWYTESVKSWTPELLQWIIENYTKGMSPWELSQKTESTPSTIRNLLRRNGLQIRPIKEVNQKHHYLSPEEKGENFSGSAQRRKSAGLTDIAKQFIREQGHLYSPSWVCHKFAAPIRAVVEYYIEAHVPFNDSYLVYVAEKNWPWDKQSVNGVYQPWARQNRKPPKKMFVRGPNPNPNQIQAPNPLVPQAPRPPRPPRPPQDLFDISTL